jgi:hypothetical protein
MNVIDMKKGAKVTDKKRPTNGCGVIATVKRTVLRVKYPATTVQYDINEALASLEVKA